MGKAINLNADTFPAAASSGIVARRGVVFDTSTRGNVKLPASTPETTFAGVTLEKVSAANNVAVQTDGVALIESDGSAVVNPGDDIILVGTTGRAKSHTFAAGDANLYLVIGKCFASAQIPATAGELIPVHLSPHLVCAA